MQVKEIHKYMYLFFKESIAQFIHIIVFLIQSNQPEEQQCTHTHKHTQFAY